MRRGNETANQILTTGAIHLVLLLLLPLPLAARVNVALFPLENRSGDPLLDWVGYSVPEVLFARLYGVEQVQVWNPVLLSSVDTSAWRLEVDSLMQQHADRWHWDVAVGGYYEATPDSAWFHLRVVRRRQNELLKREWELAAPVGQHLRALDRPLFELLSALKVPLSSQDSASLRLLPPGKPQAYATYAAGYGHEMHGRFGYAVTAYHQAVKLDDGIAPAHYRLGILYRRNRQWEAARSSLERAVDRAPEYPLYVSAMAELLAAHDLPKKAVDFVTRHGRVLELSADGLRAIGTSYLLTGEYQRAIAVLTRALAAGPSDLETDFVLGKAYMATGDFVRASSVFSRLIKYRPRYVRYYSFLGAAYRSAGRLMESSSALEVAKRLEPDNVPNLINLSNTYFELGWYERAERILGRARELSPDLTKIYVNLGVVYWHMDKKKDAARMFKQAGDRKSRYPAALTNLANMLFLSGDVRDAIRVYRRADKYGTSSESLSYNLGMAYLEINKLKKAMECFEQVILQAPGRLDVLTTLAEIAERRDDQEAAELYYRRIHDLSPGNREAVKSLAALLEKEKRFEEAVKLVETHLQSAPSDRYFQVLLPRLYQRMEWYQVAVIHYQKLVEDKEFATSYEVHLGLGQSLLAAFEHTGNTDYDKAIQVLMRASELSPADPLPEALIGRIYLEYKSYPELAKDHFDKAMARAGSRKQKRMVQSHIRRGQQ